MICRGDWTSSFSVFSLKSSLAFRIQAWKCINEKAKLVKNDMGFQWSLAVAVIPSKLETVMLYWKMSPGSSPVLHLPKFKGFWEKLFSQAESSGWDLATEAITYLCFFFFVNSSLKILVHFVVFSKSPHNLQGFIIILVTFIGI